MTSARVTKSRLLVLAVLLLWPLRALAPAPVYFDLVGLVLAILAWFLAVVIFGIASLRKSARVARWVLLGLVGIPVMTVLVALMIGGYFKERETQLFQASLKQLCEVDQGTNALLGSSAPSSRPAMVLVEYARAASSPDGGTAGSPNLYLLAVDALDYARHKNLLCKNSRIRGYQTSSSSDDLDLFWHPICYPPAEPLPKRPPLKEAEYTLVLGHRQSLHSLESPTGSVSVELASVELIERHSGRKLFETSVCSTNAHGERGQRVVDSKFDQLARLLAQAVPLQSAP